MTAKFSVAALEAMGFRELVARGEIKATFMSVTVYEVRGIAVPEGLAEARRARVAGTEYRVAIAEKVNAGSRALIGDDFADSEEVWRSEVKSNGPFVLIAVGPTEYIECEAGRMKRSADGNIATYDSFPGLREILGSLEQRVLPPVVAALTIAFNEPDHYVALRKLARASCGRCPDGTTVHDMRVDVHGELTVSRKLEAITVGDKIESSVAKAPKLHQRAANYFALGCAENDQLKRFLYFFLSLEVETHAVFGRISDRANTASLLPVGSPGSRLPSSVELLVSKVTALDNLFDRFVWCANTFWTHLAEDDVALFKKLKGARDAIAHGRESEPPAGFARSAELLAHKVLWR